MDEKRKALHDVSNMLGVIMGNAELSKQHLIDGNVEKVEERLGIIIEVVQRSAYILRNLNKKPDVSISE